MKKKMLSLLLALAMVWALLPPKAMAEETIHVSTAEELVHTFETLASNTTVILDSTDYTITSDMCESLQIGFPTPCENVTIQGTGNTRILFGPSLGGLFIYGSNITIRDISLEGSGLETYGLINVEGELNIVGCKFSNARNAIMELSEAGPGSRLVANKITVQDCTSFILEFYGDANFEDCTFLNNGHVETWEYGIKLWPVDENTMVSFKNCIFTNNGNPIFIDNRASWGDTTANYTLEGCTFENNAWGEVKNTVTVSASEYIYDAPDPAENLVLPTDALENVTDSNTAVMAVEQLTGEMTGEQKASPTGADLATLYAETAVSKAASKAVDGGEIIVNAASVADLAAAASQAARAVESALSGGGVTTARYLTKTVTFTTDETAISIQVDPDILTAQVDRVRVETPSYALTLKISDLKDDLTEPLVFKAEEVISSYALQKSSGKATVKIELPKVQMTNPVIVSLPRDSGNTTYQAVVKTDGSAASSKFNPASLTVDGRVNSSGTYTVKGNEKSFTDISGKSAEMQKAILYLTSKGIINGTSATEFSPDNSINRQQIAALLMRALGKVDNTATTTFTDVSSSSSLYRAIASSQRHGIINGYSDNTFRGANVISKSQIVTVSGRVLSSEMNYKTPANTGTYLGKYSDSVPDYAQSMVALATQEGLVVYRTDGTFSGDKNMTRGDAAIILYRLFQKIW